ncbi:Aste57867_15347 [Aphanomyces stellatus]|uniref:Aste57867_15347 protein n=1 Tax=Aphanomyces stellatus TaxID=120398 RepID=A0A485L4A2_9STRA|nr:hypothetical protein As57867_015291 [Aphanomyces stellatus]VFT92155.1 Aste57867_15347 [Aphanomyces stellatus]
MQVQARRATADEVDAVEAFLRASYVECGKMFPYVHYSRRNASFYVTEDAHGEIIAAANVVIDLASSSALIEHLAVAPQHRRNGKGACTSELSLDDAFKGVASAFLVDMETHARGKQLLYVAFLADASPNTEAWARERLFQEYSGGFIADSTDRYIIYRKPVHSDKFEPVPDLMGDFLAQVDDTNETPATHEDSSQDKNMLFASLLSNIPLGKLEAIASSLDDDDDNDATTPEFLDLSSSPRTDDNDSLDSLVRLLMTQLGDADQRRALLSG